MNEPTHSGGHTSDLVITRTDTEVTDLHVGDMISDHALVLFYTRLKKPRSDTQLITSRAWSRLSHDAFASDLSESRLCGDTTELADMSADDLVDLYRRVMTDLLDKHCPVVQVRRRNKPGAPWFDADYHAARRRARAAECMQCTGGRVLTSTEAIGLQG